MTTQTAAREPATAPESLANGVRDTIRRHMEGAGLGVSALARKAGIGHGTLIDFMNGKTDSLRLDNMAAVADALDISLGELLGEMVTAHADSSGAATLPHGAIRPDPDNPRGPIGEQSVAEMAGSIRSAGLLTPLRVAAQAMPWDAEDIDRCEWSADAAHMLIAGERRWRAIGVLIAEGHWPADREIPVIFGAAAERPGDRMIEALVENLQREDLAPLEEARAVARLIDDYGLTTAAIANAAGRTQRHVQLRLDLVRKLTPAVQRALHADEITLAAARLLTAAPADRQESALPEIAAGSYGWEDAAAIKKSLFRDMIPVGRNLFRLEAWEGDIVEDPDDAQKRWFPDKALFATLQRAAAEEKKAALEAEGYQWVRLVDRSRYDNFQWYDYSRHDGRAPGKSGAVVEIRLDLTVDIIKGVYKSGAAGVPVPGKKPGAPATEIARKATAEAAAKQPVKVTLAHMIAARQAKTDSLQAALAARPAMALRAAVLGMLINGRGAIRLRRRDHDKGHDRPPGGRLARLAERWAAAFQAVRDSWRDRILSVDDGDEEKQVKAWQILCAMDDAEVAELHALLVAEACGSWSGHNPGLGDAALAVAMAGSLGLEAAQDFAIDEAFLKTCGKGQLLQIARASSENHDLKNIKVKDLLALVLADVESGAIAGHIPPALYFGSPEDIEKRLPKKGDQ